MAATKQMNLTFNLCRSKETTGEKCRGIAREIYKDISHCKRKGNEVY